MNFEQTINEELKKSIKSGDKTRMLALRSLRAEIIKFNKSGADREMNEDDAQKILKSEAKKRRDAIALYEKGNRAELAEKEKNELVIIEEFLPKQLSDDEVKNIVAQKIEEVGASSMKDMGKLMKPLMKELNGRADGKKVQEIVRNLLGAG